MAEALVKGRQNAGVTEEEFVVESLIGKKICKTGVKYLVKWWKCEIFQASWEPVDGLYQCTSMINLFEEQLARSRASAGSTTRQRPDDGDEEWEDGVPPPPKRRKLNHNHSEKMLLIQMRELFPPYRLRVYEVPRASVSEGEMFYLEEGNGHVLSNKSQIVEAWEGVCYRATECPSTEDGGIVLSSCISAAFFMEVIADAEADVESVTSHGYAAVAAEHHLETFGDGEPDGESVVSH